MSSVSASTGSNDAVVMSGDVITMQDAPASYPMHEEMVDGAPSGYSATCTVSSTHTGGIRVKTDGQGLANERIQFNVVDVTLADPQPKTTEWVDVNQQGAFRTSWRPIDTSYFPAGHDLECRLTRVIPGTGDIALARSSSTFPAP
jgi:hypothetical protein